MPGGFAALLGGVWTRKSDFPGGHRVDAYGFAIGNKAYVGGCVCNENDLWEYDPILDTWTQKSNPPWTSSLWPKSFGIGNNGYVYIDSANQFWQYLPFTDTWIQKADLPGGNRILPVSFVINGKLYLGGGSNFSTPYYNSFFSYDTTTDTWDSLANIPMYFYEAFAFSLNNFGYVTGILDTSAIESSVLEYNSISNSWSFKLNFPGLPRTEGSALNIGNIGYFGVGDPGTGDYLRDWWQYNPISDSWIIKDSIPSMYGKDENASFSVNNTGYILFGNDGLNVNAEVWEYTPDSISTTEIGIIDRNVFQTKLSPNPTTSSLTITSRQPINQITITNLLGHVLYTKSYHNEEVQVDVSGLSNGMYFVTVNGTEVRKLLKE